MNVWMVENCSESVYFGRLGVYGDGLRLVCG